MDRHIVIAGQGRAGTTMFYNMLRGTLLGFTMPDKEDTAHSYVGKDGNFVTKRPFDIFEIPNLLNRLQGKKSLDLIITMRDPRDLLLSKHKRVPDTYFVSADKCWFIPPNVKPRFIGPGILPIHLAITSIINSGIFPQGVMVLKYEDLIANPEGIKEILAESLGLEFVGDFSDFHKNDIPEGLTGPLNGVRPVEKPKGEKWKKEEYRGRIIDQFTRFPELHAVLTSFGYETNKDWFYELLESR